jgi:RNA polymerase sigma factor (TIGR02999 family)
MANPPGDVTRKLMLARAGDTAAQEELLPLLYGELRSMAAAVFADRRSTLQPTLLVHDAYLRLVGQDVAWEGRRHFLALAASAMRQILAGHARRNAAEKRGGGGLRVTLSGSDLAGTDGGLGMVEFHDLLSRLEAMNTRYARVVEFKLLGGLEHKDIAELLGVSLRTVELDWRTARAWLRRELAPSDGGRT